MKNISLSATWRSVISDVNITTIAVDIENACLWIASERLNADADTEIDVYKRRFPTESYELQDVSILHPSLHRPLLPPQLGEGSAP